MFKKLLLFSMLLGTNTLYAGEVTLSQYQVCELMAAIVEVAANLRDLGLEQSTTVALIKKKNTLESVDVKKSIDHAIELFVPQVYEAKDVPVKLMKAVAFKACLTAEN
jgi:hypothetical protein